MVVRTGMLRLSSAPLEVNSSKTLCRLDLAPSSVPPPLCVPSSLLSGLLFPTWGSILSMLWIRGQVIRSVGCALTPCTILPLSLPVCFLIFKCFSLHIPSTSYSSVFTLAYTNSRQRNLLPLGVCYLPYALFMFH